MLCIECSEENGMLMGVCFACKNIGPIWCDCEWCYNGQNVPKEYALCDECEDKGPINMKCDNEDCGGYGVYKTKETRGD
jgi:hypothetical protein